MKYRSHISVICILLAITIFSFIMPDDVLARAGGGGGGKGGGILGFILAPFFIIYSAITTYMVMRKNRKCNELLSKISSLDSTWDLDLIKSRIEISFLKIQEAWMKRDQEIAKDYMSERLYLKHKTQTDQMISDNRKNILENINLKEAKIVEIADFKDDSKDRFWVYIKGSMVDYTIDTTNGKVVSGERGEIENFSELWKYIRINNNWVLDEIDQDVEISDLKGFNSFSEEIQ